MVLVSRTTDSELRLQPVLDALLVKEQFHRLTVLLDPGESGFSRSQDHSCPVSVDAPAVPVVEDADLATVFYNLITLYLNYC